MQHSCIRVFNTNIISYHFQYNVSHMLHHIHIKFSYRVNIHFTCIISMSISHITSISHIASISRIESISHVWYFHKYIINKYSNSYFMNHGNPIIIIYIYTTHSTQKWVFTHIVLGIIFLNSLLDLVHHFLHLLHIIIPLQSYTKLIISSWIPSLICICKNACHAPFSHKNVFWKFWTGYSSLA